MSIYIQHSRYAEEANHSSIGMLIMPKHICIQNETTYSMDLMFYWSCFFGYKKGKSIRPKVKVCLVVKINLFGSIQFIRIKHS